MSYSKLNLWTVKKGFMEEEISVLAFGGQVGTN